MHKTALHTLFALSCLTLGAMTATACDTGDQAAFDVDRDGRGNPFDAESGESGANEESGEAGEVGGEVGGEAETGEASGGEGEGGQDEGVWDTETGDDNADEAGDGDDGDDGGDDGDDGGDDDDDDCVRTQGYWKNHHSQGKGKNQKIPWPLPEDAELCGQVWLDVFNTPPKGDAFYILAHQWMAASLNVAAGALPSDEVSQAIEEATALLETCEISADDRPRAIELSELLDAFNNGQTDHSCDDGDDESGGEEEGGEEESGEEEGGEATAD